MTAYLIHEKTQTVIESREIDRSERATIAHEMLAPYVEGAYRVERDSGYMPKTVFKIGNPIPIRDVWGLYKDPVNSLDYYVLVTRR